MTAEAKRADLMLPEHSATRLSSMAKGRFLAGGFHAAVSAALAFSRAGDEDLERLQNLLTSGSGLLICLRARETARVPGLKGKPRDMHVWGRGFKELVDAIPGTNGG